MTSHVITAGRFQTKASAGKVNRTPFILTLGGGWGGTEMHGWHPIPGGIKIETRSTVSRSGFRVEK